MHFIFFPAFALRPLTSSKWPDGLNPEPWPFAPEPCCVGADRASVCHDPWPLVLVCSRAWLLPHLPPHRHPPRPVFLSAAVAGHRCGFLRGILRHVCLRSRWGRRVDSLELKGLEGFWISIFFRILFLHGCNKTCNDTYRIRIGVLMFI